MKPRAVYQIYRPAEEIEKAADTFNGLPLSLDHWEMNAENMPKEKIVGSLGIDVTFDGKHYDGMMRNIRMNIVLLSVKDRWGIRPFLLQVCCKN